MTSVPAADWLLPAAPVTATDVKALTSAVAAGDEDAFSRFFRARFDQMLVEARRATGRDDAFCHDVVQDAMLRVIRVMKPLESEAALNAWLRTVVRSCAYDRLRSDRRRRRRELAVGPPAGSGDGRPDDLEERVDWLAEQLRAVDDRSLQMLLMRHRFGWTLQQIGSALGVSPGAVDGRLRRLVRTLRRRAQQEHTP